MYRDNVARTMGQWTMDNGQWTMDNGQWDNRTMSKGQGTRNKEQ